MKLALEQIDAAIAVAVEQSDWMALRQLMKAGCLAREQVTETRLALIEPLLDKKGQEVIALVNSWMGACAARAPSLAAQMTFRTLKKIKSEPSANNRALVEFARCMIEVGVDPYIVLTGEDLRSKGPTENYPFLSEPSLLAGMFAYLNEPHMGFIIDVMHDKGLTPTHKGQAPFPYAGVLHRPADGDGVPGRTINLLEASIIKTMTGGFDHVFIAPKMANAIALADGTAAAIAKAMTDTLIVAAENGSFTYEYAGAATQIIAQILCHGAQIDSRPELASLEIQFTDGRPAIRLLELLCTGHQIVGRGGEDRFVPPALKALLNSGYVDLDAAGSGQRTLLHEACRCGLSDRVKVLLEAGASIEAKDADGCTPKDLALATRALQVETGSGMPTEIQELDHVVAALDVTAAKQRIGQVLGRTHAGGEPDTP